MALRTKTIEYVFPMNTTDTASGTARNFTSITVNIPENTSRTFRSVVLQISFEDNVANGGTAGNPTTIVQGISIGAVAIDLNTVVQTLSNSGENHTYTVIRDCTAYFQTNFTGTSQTVGARATITMSNAASTINHTAKLIITYEYDDSAQTTRIKTVKIPIDGNIGILTNGALTTTGTDVGGLANQIPALDTFLPESTKTYRDIFFEVFSHTGQTAGTGAYALNMSYNEGTTTITTTHQGGLNADYMIHRIDKLISAGTPSFTTNATHSVRASSVAGTNAPHPCLCGVLVVTYEYDHSASTTILNSIEIPAVDEAGNIGGTVVGDASRFDRTFFIQEPGTITLVQSGVLLSYVDQDSVTLDVRNGAQTSRVFTHAASLRAGGMFNSRRLDSGAAGGGAGYTFAKGLNTLSLTFFTSGATAGQQGTNISGVYFLNYTSGKDGNGDGVHSHTTKWLNLPYTAATLVRRFAYTQNKVPIIPETNYYTVGVSFDLTMQAITGSGPIGICLQGELGAGEGQGAGWYDFYSTFLATDNPEAGQYWSWLRARDEFKRHPNDPDTERLNLETSRSFKFDSASVTVSPQLMQTVTYHSITTNISADILNSSGGLVTLNLHRSDNGELVRIASRTGDGNVQFEWYDDTIEMYIVAIDVDQSTAVHSSLFFAGNQTPLLDFAGGGPTYYAYAG